jgi:hypothetical protein
MHLAVCHSLASYIWRIILYEFYRWIVYLSYFFLSPLIVYTLRLLRIPVDIVAFQCFDRSASPELDYLLIVQTYLLSNLAGELHHYVWFLQLYEPSPS